MVEKSNEKIINLLENKICTGCGACYNICPVNAIRMVHNDKGFYVPQIDDAKCVKCGKCVEICPLDKCFSNNKQPTMYAFINSDTETRLKSSSGSAFSLFAKEIINRDGIVFGVVWDENIKAVHTCAKTNEELEKMYSSKYVQSNTNDTFKKAKEFLNDGKFVLFSGTPCQIAGLKSYLNKDYENLIAIDLVCHGTPSPLVLEKYKKEFMQDKKDKGEILNINFRFKKKGWTPQYYITSIRTTNKTYNIPNKDDEYMQSFQNNLSFNDSCCDCQFSRIPRISDITIGDFWGVNEFDKSLNDEKGTSIVILNSQKGELLFNELKNRGIYKNVPFEDATKYNYNIIHSSTQHKNRKLFFELFLQKKLTLKEINKKCIKRFPQILVFLFKLLPRPIKNVIKKVLNI